METQVPAQEIKLGEISVEVIYKNIKNLHLSVFPPTGKVRIAAPLRMDLDTIRVFTLSKLSWIKKQQERFRKQERESPREYLNRESHYFRGKRYLLKVLEEDAAPRVMLKHSRLELHVRPGTDPERMRVILDEWYRAKLKEVIPGIISRWETILDVKVEEFGVKKMKTRWGTCNREEGRIWLNLELAKKPPECLEYIVVHEMTHIIERSHGERFIALLDKVMPKWRYYRDELNRLPVKHEEWRY